MESMTRSTHMKKLPKAVTSFSGGYDVVFSAPVAAQRFKPPFNVEDYGEIFGGGSRGSSIPVLDLAVLDETTENFRSSKVDYGSIFGGLEEDLGVPYEELVGRGCGNKKWSSSNNNNKARNHSEKEFPPQGEDTRHVSANSKEPPSEAPNTSIDAMKQFNMSYLKTSQENKKQPNGTTHVAKLHAVPGFTYFVNEPPSKKKTERGMPVAPIKGEVNRTWNFSGNVPDESNRNTEVLLPGKPTAEGLSGAKGGSWLVGSQSKDGSVNRSGGDMKSQSFKTAPSSNNFLESSGIKGHPKRSKSSNISSKVNPFEKSTSNGTDGSSDEELDINSEAAACAAALKRVLEKAQESIRLAQEIRERGDKDGIQRGSNLNSEHSSEAKDKKKHGFDQEGNYSKKQNVKDRHERLGSESDESNERNSRFSSRNAGVSTASECGQEPLTSTEAAEEKSWLNIAEVDGKSKQFLEPVDTGTNIASTMAFHQVEMDKSTTFLSMRKQETEASLSMEKQENIFGETTTKETTEQIENNVEIEKSSEKDFGMGNAENNELLDEQTKVSEVTANASDSAPIKHEFRTTVGLEITENDAQSKDIKCILDKLRHCEIKLSECLDMSEEEKSEASKTEDQHMSNEWQTMAKEGVPHEDFQQVQYFDSHSQEEKESGLYSFNKGGEVHQEACSIVPSDDAPEVCGSGSLEREHNDSQEGEARVTSNGLDSFHEGDMVQQEACGFMESDDAPEICGSGSQESTHKDGQEGEACTASNGLDSCNGRGTIQQEACGFVASDDAPEICNSGSQERTHKDSQEGEACAASNRLDSCNERRMVQQEACGFVASYDAPEVCSRGSWERTHKDSQEGEACRTFDAIQEIGIGVNDSNLISGHKLEEDPTVPYEELKKKVVEDPNEKKLVDVPWEEKSTKVLKEEYFEREEQKISEDSYNQEKVDCNSFGEEFDWGEVEKRIKKGCTIEDTEMVWSENYKNSECSNAVELIQETEESTGVHEEDTFDNNEQIHLQKKAASEKNFDPDAYESLHGVQEAHSTGVVEDHEASNSTTGTSEDFYNCEWEGNSEEEVLKACDFTKLDEKSDFVFVDRASSSENPGHFMAVESDENGTNADDNGVSCEHKLPQENVLETTYFIQDAEEGNDIRFKQQALSEDQKSTNVAFSADRLGVLTENNVKEPEPSINFESGGEFVDGISENAERANEEFSLAKKDEYADPEVVCKVEKKEKEIDEINSSPVTHQGTDTHESAEEMITGQNIQFVRSKPQKIALPEDNEARDSSQKDLKEKEHSRKIEEMKRERARDKDRIAVERAIREARERAFAEARERAERTAVARAGAEVRQRMMAEAREKLEKASAETKLADKASIEAKQRAERAAVERATAEARERALEKALSQKTTSQGRVQTDRLDGTPKDSALKHSLSSSDLERDGNNSESAQRRKARNERHERIMERSAQALAEKNMRDLHAQKEQAERNRLAESLDADVKRWANGKEKNLRALLSTLQYILGPDSGWQPISLTEIVTTAAVKKTYKKSTLYVHPDKLQQRGASIQQKYICEKVFELLKAAWNKFNSEER